MKKTKRLLVVVLAMVLTLTGMSLHVFVADSVSLANYDYDVNENRNIDQAAKTGNPEQTIKAENDLACFGTEMFTVTYGANRPESRDTFTEQREVYIGARVAQNVEFDPQPATMVEVKALIDAYEVAYQEALAGGGFLAALEVQKPHWQYEVAENLMPRGWNCQLVNWDDDFGADYYTFFPNPKATAIDSRLALQNAINGITEGTIEISDDIVFDGTVVTIAAGQNIKITSESDAVTLTQNVAGIRHFRVNGGTLTLENIILDGGGTGGGIYAGNGNLTLNGATVQNCYTIDSGGGINVYGTNLTLNGAVIQGCQSNGGGYGVNGGGIYVNGGSLNITDSLISENRTSSYGNGGGIAVYGSSTFTIEKSTIENNKGGYGGAICAGMLINITDCIINGNTAIYDAGGIFVSAAELNITGSTISHNTATYYGGGISLYDSSLIITDSQISDNTSGYAGGGIEAAYNVEIEIKNGVMISGNKVTSGEGGGIFSVGKSLTIDNSTISGNTAAGKGGGIYIDDRATLTTSSSVVFTGNSANAAYNYGLENKSNYPKIDWAGDNSILGTHALNNYDINYTGGAALTLATVNFDANGGSPTPASQTIASGVGKAAEPATAPTKATVTFAGWQTVDGILWDFDTIVDENMTLYARWAANPVTYTVTFHKNYDGDNHENYGSDNTVTRTVTAPATTVDAANIPSLIRAGYSFKGWNANADGSGKLYAPGDNITVTEDMNLYAQWEKTTSGGNTTSTDTPKTGDTSNTVLWIVLLLVSLSGSVIMLFFNKRKQHKS